MFQAYAIRVVREEPRGGGEAATEITPTCDYSRRAGKRAMNSERDWMAGRPAPLPV